jgi:hypothetical protein
LEVAGINALAIIVMKQIDCTPFNGSTEMQKGRLYLQTTWQGAHLPGIIC